MPEHAADDAPPEVSEDTLLDGRVRLVQPRRGYRVAIDPVLLAAAVPARAGERVLDAGAGVGAAALCLAARVPGCRATGLERDAALVRLAAGNAARNGLDGRLDFVAGDVAEPPPRLAPGSFDHVMANPPHLAPAAARASPLRDKARATVEDETGLSEWVRFGAIMARSGGSLTFIHRADRLDALLAALRDAAGGVVVYPLWPGAGRAAKRVLVQARKDSAAPLALAAGMVLHRGDGGYTPEAEAVLRAGGALALSP